MKKLLSLLSLLFLISCSEFKKNKVSNEAQTAFANQLLDKFKAAELSKDKWWNTIDEIIFAL